MGGCNPPQRALKGGVKLMGVWYEGLRVAILQQAAKDYTAALKEGDEREAASIERFFLGDWGQLLSGDKGELIIAKCRQRANVP